MLRTDRLDVAHGRTQAIFGVSLEVPDGAITCIIGRNGAGKTTLLNAIMGVLRPVAGRVEWDGADITRSEPYERVRRGLGYVPQGHATFPQLTVLENLVVVSEAGRAPRSRVDEVLDLFPRLQPLSARRAGILSGGQQQQLAIARALVAGPRLLLLDEPTEGIQPSIIDEIEEVILRLRTAWGLTILLVEQYVEFAMRLADRYAVLDAGEIVGSGDTGDAEEGAVHRLLAV